MSPEIIKSLEGIVNKGIEEIALPYVKGSIIRIKNYLVQENSSGWVVYNNATSARIAKFFCKAGALALAKSLSEGRNRTSRIIELDKIIQKNYTDCIFYKNVLQTSTDDFKRAVTQDRFEISKRKAKKARHSLVSIIFQR